MSLLLLSVLQVYIKIACYCGEPMILADPFLGGGWGSRERLIAESCKETSGLGPKKS